MKESVTGCTHCGVCTENCEFLKKYDLTIGDTEKLSKMTYHCFLCGKCSKVCPQGIDGREIVLQIRRHRVKEAGGRIPEKGYGMLLWEKEDYKFRRYTGTGKTALFFGCNFPSFYPETTRYLGKLLAEKADAFSVFDCCGKPIAELGLEEKETVILERLNKKLLEAGVREVVMVCPNCYAFLKDKLSVPVISIYEKLQELGLGNRIMEEQNIFLPCPDREKRDSRTEDPFKCKLLWSWRLRSIERTGTCSSDGKISRQYTEYKRVLCLLCRKSHKSRRKKYKTSAGTDPWKRRSAGCKAFSVEPGSCRKIEEGESMKKNKNKWIEKVILIVCVVAAIAVYMAVPSVHQGMNCVFAMFATGDFTVLRDFVASYGAYAAALSFLLMILQSIIAPLPAFLITFANANLFGWWKGAILSWSSAMAGAAICFYIARILGRDVAEKLTSRSGLAQIDTFFEKYGKNTILICRLLPFVSFDIVSYAAGLTSMSFSSFFIATGIGQLPATIVYSYVGGMLTGGAKLFVTGLLIIFALSALIFMMRSIYMEHMKKKRG